MTDPDTADAVYVEPINWPTLARVIEKEKPDALLPTMGGQTALNCALDLDREGILEAHGVELIGASRTAINKAEDRDLFRKAMNGIGLATPQARASPTAWRRPTRRRRRSASPASSDRRSRSAAPAAASPSTGSSSRRSASAAWICRRRTSC